MDDLSYDELDYDDPTSSAAGQVLTGLVVLLIAVLGAPQVWDALHSKDFGPELVFFPVLVLALGPLAFKRRST